jgi:hypothetical protein
MGIGSAMPSGVMSSMDEAQMLLHGVLGAAERSERFLSNANGASSLWVGLRGTGVVSETLVVMAVGNEVV